MLKMYINVWGLCLSVGGSLTVQIFGSSSPNKSREEECNEKDDHLLVPDKQSGFSTSPVVAKFRKDASDI